MATSEAAGKIQDVVSAQLVECAPVEEAPVSVPLPDPPPATPIRETLAATVEQTGADPPPREA